MISILAQSQSQVRHTHSFSPRIPFSLEYEGPLDRRKEILDSAQLARDGQDRGGDVRFFLKHYASGPLV